MKSQDILAYVEENSICRVYRAAKATMRNPDARFSSDALPGLAAIARLTKQGRLIRVPSGDESKLNDWILLSTFKDTPFLLDYLDFLDCAGVWSEENVLPAQYLARDIIEMHPFPEHTPCFANGRAREAVLEEVFVECVAESCCGNWEYCVFGVDSVYFCAAIPVNVRFHDYIMDGAFEGRPSKYAN